VDVAIRRQGGSGVEQAQRVSLEPGGTVLVELRPGVTGNLAGSLTRRHRNNRTRAIGR
jgi:hypothetical protein